MVADVAGPAVLGDEACDLGPGEAGLTVQRAADETVRRRCGR